MQVPGLYKIFDEIVVNAADNKQRDPTMDCMKVTIDKENNSISVWNNGNGIPVAMHSEQKMYVPELIFGHLLAGSNFDDDRMGGIEKKWRSEYRREYLQKSIIEAKSTLATGVRSECVQFLA